MWFVCSKVRDVFNTIDTAASGRLCCQDVSIPLHSVLCFIVWLCCKRNGIQIHWTALCWLKQLISPKLNSLLYFACRSKDVNLCFIMSPGKMIFAVLVFAGHSGLAVACLTAVREVLGSNRAVGSCVYRTTTVIYSLGYELCAPFLQCLGQLSLLPSVGR